MSNITLNYEGVLPYTLSIKTCDHNEIDVQLSSPIDKDSEDAIISKVIEHFGAILSIDLKDSDGNVIATYYSAK